MAQDHSKGRHLLPRRRYYGRRVAVYLFVVSFATMAAAGLVIGLVFNATGGTPVDRAVTAFQAYPSWNATTVVNIAFLLLMIVLGVRFLRTGGLAMLGEMEHPPDEHAENRDPVCGMTVDPQTIQRTDHAGSTYIFCSPGCRAAFEKDPGRYTDVEPHVDAVR